MSELQVNKIVDYDSGSLAVDTDVNIGVASTKSLDVSGALDVGGALDVDGVTDLRGTVNLNTNALSGVTTVGCVSVNASGSMASAGLTTSAGVTLTGGDLSVSDGDCTIDQQLVVTHTGGTSADYAVTCTNGGVDTRYGTLHCNELIVGTSATESYTAGDFANFASTTLIKACATVTFDFDGAGDGSAVTIGNGTGISCVYETTAQESLRFNFNSALSSTEYMVLVGGTQGNAPSLVGDDLATVWSVSERSTDYFIVRLMNSGGDEAGHLSVLVLQF